jgi:2,4'-dihydroxyacetophenone dioxygenase
VTGGPGQEARAEAAAGLAAPWTSAATCVDEQDRPWVDSGRGSMKQMVRLHLDSGTWIIRDRFQPGYRAQRHRHTGPVHAFTTSGAWRYEEYDFVAGPGSYVHEPANSVHTLDVPRENADVTEVLFIVEGGLLMLDDDDAVTAYVDGFSQVADYLRLCREQGHPEPSGLMVS